MMPIEIFQKWITMLKKVNSNYTSNSVQSDDNNATYLHVLHSYEK